MTRSIRFRFTAVFIGLTILMLAGICIVNSLFLEQYYEKYKTGVLESGYLAIEETMSQENWEAEIEETIRRLRDTSNISVLVYDSMKDKILISSSRDDFLLQNRVRSHILGLTLPDQKLIAQEENYTIQKSLDPVTGTSFLEIWGYFNDNGTAFIMSTPLDSIREGTRISNRFLLYIGFISILFSMVVLYFLTGYFTAPIRKLSELSEQMSRLDFQARYQPSPHSSEELDRLGNSMNILSESLEHTIGELRDANEQLQRDIDEKIQIDDMRKEFIANVSHELKTPIALIQGYAEGLVEGMAEDPENRDYYCGVIMDEAGKMNRMVKQLLTLTSIEYGGEKPVIADFDLSELLRGVLGAGMIMLTQEGITLQEDFPEELPARGDEFQIEQVVTNYLNNAIHHAEGQKEIRVSASVTPEGKVRTEIFNTGKPVPEEALPNLWTKFYKVDKARTRRYGGSGIGLSIVKAIMDAHGEAYGVENRENGVAFWFELEPAEEEREE